uniref:Uncharacterized protein n=1 Tax=Romanomermis culicivorax TaxID=13658 RepID=A0A915KXX6_ROMCU
MQMFIMISLLIASNFGRSDAESRGRQHGRQVPGAAGERQSVWSFFFGSYVIWAILAFFVLLIIGFVLATAVIAFRRKAKKRELKKEYKALKAKTKKQQQHQQLVGAEQELVEEDEYFGEDALNDSGRECCPNPALRITDCIRIENLGNEHRKFRERAYLTQERPFFQGRDDYTSAFTRMKISQNFGHVSAGPKSKSLATVEETVKCKINKTVASDTIAVIQQPSTTKLKTKTRDSANSEHLVIPKPTSSSQSSSTEDDNHADGDDCHHGGSVVTATETGSLYRQVCAQLDPSPSSMTEK